MPTKIDLDIVIGVDDTGSEGEAVESRSVDRNRQTFVAAVIGKEDLAAFTSDWNALIGTLAQDFGVTEFHSSKLWGGSILNAQSNKKVKLQAEQNILLAFRKATEICILHGVAFVVQTVHGETFKTLLQELRSASDAPHFIKLADELTTPSENRKLASFILLSRRVLDWSRKFAASQNVPKALLDVNAEWKIDGATDFASLSTCAELFCRAGYGSTKFQFTQSHECALIQAADFCAYVVNRHMYLLANRKKPADDGKLSSAFKRTKALLEQTGAILPYVLGLPVYLVKTSNAHAEKYDELQDKERAAINMDPLNFK